jgi:hypothetical protein
MILADNLKKILLQIPIYTPSLIGVPEERTTALLLRVDSPQPFKRKGLKFQVSFAGYEHEGTYLACVAFRAFDRPRDPLEGDAYLNPLQEADRQALEYLTEQERLPFVFLSADLKHEVAKSISWQQKSRDAAREVFERSASAGLLSGSFDPNFQRLKYRFQSIHSVKDLLGR